MTKSDSSSRIGNTAGILFALIMALAWMIAKPEAPTAQAAVGDLVFTIEAPGVQASQVNCPSVLEIEDFDSIFGAPTTLATYTSGTGLYEATGAFDFRIEAADAFGGAGGSGFYIATEVGDAYTVTLSQPAGYFGFWWSAGDGNNEVTVNMSDGTSQTFSTQSILDSSSLQGTPGVVPGGDGHFGNPNDTDPTFDNEDEVYAFVNIFSTNPSAKITSIVFTEKPGGAGRFESDSHSVCTDILDPNTGSPIAQTGTIVIKKNTDPAGATDLFDFNHDIPGGSSSFQLSHGGVQTFTDVPIGEYEVTEENPASVGSGYFLNNLTCEDSVSGGVASTTNLGERKATIQLDTGETVTCAFTNIVPKTLRFTIEAPGVQTSQVQTCTNLRTETFDGYDVDSYSTVFSAKLGIYARLGGAADFDIKAQDEFGGAETPTPTPPDTEKFIGTTQSEYTLTFNPITFPDGVGYFGFWWSAGDGENVLEITRNDGTVETFTTQSILNSPALQGSPNPGSGVVDGHFGNPTAAYLGVNAGEAYAFVNIFARDDASRIKSIRFIETGPSSFESDNHTVCADLIDGNNQGGTELGAIIIKKVTIPANSLLFNFTDDIESPNAFSLSNGGVKTFLKVAPGAYTVTEAAGNGAYEARDVTCVDGDPNGKPSSGSVDTITRTGTATINVDANETVTCTFTNSNQPLAITLGWFLAEANGDSVDFRWQTATETGTAGFNLMAATEEGKVQLNGELIPSPVVDSLTPTNYAVSLATDATLFYLQEASVDGSVTEHGPFALGEAYGEYSVPGGVELSPRIWLPLMVR